MVGGKGGRDAPINARERCTARPLPHGTTLASKDVACEGATNGNKARVWAVRDQPVSFCIGRDMQHTRCAACINSPRRLQHAPVAHASGLPLLR
jgi:hypothetical protein